MKTGIVLEGGAMRGLFTAGVIDVLMENNVIFDGCVGVSAGAAFGCNLKSGQPGRVLRYNLRFCRDKRYCSLWSLITTGDMFGADFCYHEIPDKLDIFDWDTFRKNPMEFYLVCTDMETGEALYKNCDDGDCDVLEWMRASASMPLASRIVEIEGKKLLDGGIADSIPLKYFEGLGYDRNVVVLTQPKDYVKGPNKLLPLMKPVFGKYPRFTEAMAHRHIMYNETVRYINEKEEKGEIVVIRPEAPLPIGRTSKNPEEIKNVYSLGREAAEKHLEKIKEFLTGTD